MFKQNKKLLALIVAGFLLFSFANIALGQSVINEGVANVGQNVSLGGGDLKVIIANIIRVFLGFVAIVLVCMIIYGGFLYMTNGGEDKKIDTAKKVIINSVIGLVIIVSAFAITSFIISSFNDATGFTNGNGNGGGNGGGGNGGGLGSSGYNMTVTPTGENKPINSRATVSFPNSKAPLEDNDFADAKSKIKVYSVAVDGTKTEVAGSLDFQGNKIIYTPSGTCPVTCQATGCFEPNTKYLVEVLGLKDSGGGQPNCPNQPSGYCFSAEFMTSAVCDTKNPTATIGVIGDPIKLGNQMTANVAATDDGGIESIEFCPGLGGTCQTINPTGEPLTYASALYSPTTGMTIGNKTASFTVTDVVGNETSVTDPFLIASTNCFATGTNTFDCSLPQCEVPCGTCTTPGQCVCGEKCVNACYHGNLDNQGRPCDPVTNTLVCHFNSPTHYWDFNAGTGTTVKDLIGEVEGTIHNAKWTDDGKYGKALEFNGTDTAKDYVDFGNNLNVDTGDFSLSVWAKSKGFKASAGVVAKGAYFYGYGPGYFIGYATSPKYLYGGVYDQPIGAATASGRYGSFSLGSNGTTDNWVDTWTNFVIVKNGSTVRTYVNGVLKYTGNSVTNSLSNGKNLYLGTNATTSVDFNGTIDDFAFYDRALTGSEVSGLYSCNPTTTVTDCKQRTPTTCDAKYQAQFCFSECKSWPWPVIDSVSPTTAAKNSFITIFGKNFGSYKSDSKVYIGGQEASLACGASQSWFNDQVIVKVPNTAVNGPVKIEAGGRYNDTSDANSPGWKGSMTISATGADWLGLCSVNNEVGGKASGEPGSTAVATGENFDAATKVLFGNTETTYTFDSADKKIKSIKVPNLAVGQSPVQLSRTNTYSNVVYFNILAKQNTLKIDSVSPDKGPSGQLVTIKGANFGQSGTVYFIKGTDRFLADAACGDNWTENQIIIKVPSNLGNSNDYSIQVTGTAGTDSKKFEVDSALAVLPGICRITPDNGPAGTLIKIQGSGFGDETTGTINSNKQITFKNTSGVSDNIGASNMNLNKVVWKDTEISGLILPANVATGDIQVVTSMSGNIKSNTALFKVGKCSANSCGAGQVCCNGESCTATAQCQLTATSCQFGWYFSTGAIPQVPKIIERECVLSEVDESPSPSNMEENACPNGWASFTFNMKMDIPSMIGKKVEVRQCGVAGEQCNLNTCDTNCTKTQLTLPAATSSFYKTSTLNGKEVTQVTLNSYNFQPNTWYRVEVPAGVGAYDAKGKLVTMTSPYSWSFHTSSTNCTLSNALVSPAEGVIEQLDETQQYTVSGQANNCAILKVTGYAWDWSKQENSSPDKLERITVANEDRNINATYGLNAAAVAGTIEPETGDKPAEIKAKAIIGETTFSDTAQLAVKFLAPYVLEYWPNCDQACCNAQLGALFSTKIKKNDLYQNSANVKLYKCNDAKCLIPSSGDVNLLAPPAAISQIDCDMKTGSSTDCNQLKISPNPDLDPASYYRVVIMGNILSTSNKRLENLNYSTNAITANVCGNGVLESGEECEATCLSKTTKTACSYSPTNTDCECKVENTPNCTADCKLVGLTACSSSLTASCCGNGQFEPLGISKDYKPLLADNFKDVTKFTANGWVKLPTSGALTLNNGIDFNGTAGARRNISNLLNGKNELSIIMKFIPKHGVGEVFTGSTYYLMDTVKNGTNTDRIFIVKYDSTNSDTKSYDLRVAMGATNFYITRGAYEPYWNVNVENTLAISATSGNVKVFLNGNQIANQSTAWTPVSPDWIYLGQNYANNFKTTDTIKSLVILNKALIQTEVSGFTLPTQTEVCEATCQAVVKKDFIGTAALTTCNNYLVALPQANKVSSACNCSTSSTCDASQKTCQKYCKGDITRKCTANSLDCTCIEASFCREDVTKACDGYNVAACTCNADKACFENPGTKCTASSTGCDCREVGTYQFAPTTKCFVDAVNDPATTADETKTLGPCIKKKHCAELPTQECTESITACTCRVASQILVCKENIKQSCSTSSSGCTCMPVNSLENYCPAVNLVCPEICSIQEKTGCVAGSDNCQCNFPATCTKCLDKAAVAASSNSAFNAFSWIFKTKEGQATCKPEKVVIDPATYISTIAGEEITYSGTPITAPDVCSPSGQKLNAYDYSWNWQASPGTRALILDNVSSTADPAVADPVGNSNHRLLISIFKTTYGAEISTACGDNCLNKGSKVWGAVCGNNIVEVGEECDSTSTNCSDKCLWKGSAKCYGTTSNCCGNKTVDTSVGEECDGGAGCSTDSCLRLGSAAAGFTCGNGILESGEDEDYGQLNAKYGIDAQCLNVGSKYPKNNGVKITDAICGNGTKEAGEECDLVGTNCKKMVRSVVAGKPMGVVEVASSTTVTGSDIASKVVCDYVEDTYCKADCTLKGFPTCGTVKVCEQDNTKACTQNITACDCYIPTGATVGFCDLDNNQIKSANETASCTNDISACNCINKVINDNCCGDGSPDTYNYTVNGVSKSVTEECDTITCSKPATKKTCINISGSATNISFDEGTNNQVLDSVGNLKGSATNVVLVPGNHGNAALVTKSEEVINFGDNFDIGAGDFSISYWVKFNQDDSTKRTVLSKNNTSATDKSGLINIYTQNGIIWTEIGVSATDVRQSSTQVARKLNNNQWHNIVVSWERKNKAVIYVDGVLDVVTYISGTNTTNLTNTYPFVVGASYNGTGFNQFFNGQIDDLMIYRKSLLASEVFSMYAGCSPAASATTCDFGDEGCVCELSKACTSSCLNAGSNASFIPPTICGNGKTELGEDNACEDTSASANKHGAPYSLVNVLGYFPAVQSEESIKVQGVITAANDGSAMSSITGSGDLKYIYTGTGPTPPGCDLNNPPTFSVEGQTQPFCANGTISLLFTERMAQLHAGSDLKSFVDVYYDPTAATCDTALTFTWWEKIGNGLKLGLNKVKTFVFGGTSLAVEPCKVNNTKYTVTVSEAMNDKGQLVSRLSIVNTSSTQLKNTVYTVKIKNLNNNCQLQLPTQAVSFSVGKDACRFDNIAIEPASIFMSTRGQTQTITYRSMSGKSPIDPISGLYSWTWGKNGNVAETWTTADTALLSFGVNGSADYVQTKDKNGKTTISAHAKITEDKIFGEKDSLKEGSAPVDVFLCENPWNPDGGSIGWDGGTTGKNIGLKYCLDSGKTNDITDDLPDLLVKAAPTDIVPSTIPAQCNDGLDNDGDGKIDYNFAPAVTADMSMNFIECRVKDTVGQISVNWTLNASSDSTLVNNQDKDLFTSGGGLSVDVKVGKYDSVDKSIPVQLDCNDATRSYCNMAVEDIGTSFTSLGAFSNADPDMILYARLQSYNVANQEATITFAKTKVIECMPYDGISDISDTEKVTVFGKEYTVMIEHPHYATSNGIGHWMFEGEIDSNAFQLLYEPVSKTVSSVRYSANWPLFLKPVISNVTGAGSSLSFTFGVLNKNPDTECLNPTDIEPVHLTGATNCQDGLDNDFDGKIDQFDTNCALFGYESQATMLNQYYFLRGGLNGKDDRSSDAIALRIYTNPENISAREWFKRYVPNFGEKAEPTDIKLGCATDPSAYNSEICYYGVKDGNTIYLSGGNLTGSGTSKILYNNIYVLAYNVGANSQTVNIMAQMLNNLQLNTNAPDSSTAWAVKRDVKRVNDINDLRSWLFNYFVSNKTFPELKGGTYIRGTAMSTWPSWTNELGKGLGKNIPVDPINLFEQYEPCDPIAPNCRYLDGTDCGGAKNCRNNNDQCVNSTICSICAPGSDPVSCYNSTTLNVGYTVDELTRGNGSFLYQYIFNSLNDVDLKYILEGDYHNYYTFEKKPTTNYHLNIE